MRALIFISFLFMSIIVSAQNGSGTIKIRKTDQIIIGKTLNLHDLRTRECGTIFFEDEENCTVNFTYATKDLQPLRVFLNSKVNSKKIECEYQLISDTSFIIKAEEYLDTCYYKFINKSNNIVRFFNTPQGLFDNNNYAFFFGFDSIVYSQSYLRSLTDFKFTDSLSKIDSIYKNVRDEDKRAELNALYKKRIEAYKKSINYSFFAGKHIMSGNKIVLINKETHTPFATLFLQKKGDYYSLFSYNDYEKSYPLISSYTHKSYGEITFNYEKCYVQYRKPITDNSQEIIKGDIYNCDTLNVNYPIGEKIYAYHGLDSFPIENTKYFEYAKIKGRIGGYYNTYLESLNGNKIKTDPLFFMAKNAISVSDKALKDTIENWDYKIQNNIFFLFNDTDTLIDEMKNGFDNFKFSYHNNEPYVFGAYYNKDKRSGANEFVLLFSNNTGVKYTTEENDYKNARNSILQDELIPDESIKYSYFKYSATQEYLWIEYENGNYEEYKFFNFHKAIRLGNGKRTKNYYLVN